MARAGTSTVTLLLPLLAAISLAMTAGLMVGPLLIELSREFDTSVAVTGQLAAATFITWGITGPLVGPVSDAYGRRFVALTGLALLALGTLGSALAWGYGPLLAFRLVTGAGGAMVTPNSIAIMADMLPAERRGKAVGWLASSAWLGAAVGAPAAALLLDVGGWRLPFYVVGGLVLALWGVLWVWLPEAARTPPKPLAFFAHFREATHGAGTWYVIGAGILVQTAFFGVLTYLAAYLIETYGVREGETALPLALAGAGAIAGSLLGGYAAGHLRRLAILFVALVAGGLAAGAVFNTELSLWGTVALSFAALVFLGMAMPVLVIVIMELAGRSRATASGLFASSNQLGGVSGSAAGGLLLALGGFPLVGLFCLAAAIAAAVLLRARVRDSEEFRQRMQTGESGLM